MKIKITTNAKGNPPGKVADAELLFTDGLLSGSKLIGFAIWKRSGSGQLNVTFPARQYSVNGERRSFALLRPDGIDTTTQDKIRNALVAAYHRAEESDFGECTIDVDDNGRPQQSAKTAAERAIDYTEAIAQEKAKPQEPEPTPAAPKFEF